MESWGFTPSPNLCLISYYCAKNHQFFPFLGPGKLTAKIQKAMVRIVKGELGCPGGNTDERVEEACESEASDSEPRGDADRRVLRSRYLALKSLISGMFLSLLFFGSFLALCHLGA